MKKKIIPILMMPFLLLFSCASGLQISRGTEPIMLLPENADVYIFMESEAFMLMSTFLPIDGGSLREAMARTVRISLGASNIHGEQPGLACIAEGNYPAGFAGIYLNRKNGWKKEGSGWASMDGLWHLAFSGSKLALISNEKPETMMASSFYASGTVPGSEIHFLNEKYIGILMDEPLSLLGNYLPVDFLPDIRLSFWADRDGGLVAGMKFHLPDQAGAIMFQPFFRLLVLGMDRLLWPGNPKGVLSTGVWKLAGENLLLEEIHIGEEELLDIMGLFTGASHIFEE